MGFGIGQDVSLVARRGVEHVDPAVECDRVGRTGRLSHDEITVDDANDLTESGARLRVGARHFVKQFAGSNRRASGGCYKNAHGAEPSRPGARHSIVVRHSVVLQLVVHAHS